MTTQRILQLLSMAATCLLFCKDAQVKLVEDKGWTAETVNAYSVLRYQITGNTLTVQWIDGDAKKRALEAGKIKGKIEKDQDGNARAMFTDTTESLAKFVVEAGDDLFSKDVLKLQRFRRRPGVPILFLAKLPDALTGA
jgi:hypothetical protein